MDLIQEHKAGCPYCGEIITLVIDCSIDGQTYIEDCEVCCRPIIVTYSVMEDAFGEKSVSLELQAEDA